MDYKVNANPVPFRFDVPPVTKVTWRPAPKPPTMRRLLDFAGRIIGAVAALLKLVELVIEVLRAGFFRRKVGA